MKKLVIIPLTAAILVTPAFAKEKRQKPTAAQLIEKYDADGDSKLSEAELETMLSERPKKGKKGKKDKNAE